MPVTGRVLRAGLLYFAVVYGAGWVLGPIRVLWLTPRYGPTAAILVEAPILAAAIFVAARWSVRQMRLPGRPSVRLGVGLQALGLLLAAEVLGARWLRGLSLPEYLSQLGAMEAGLSALLWALLATMPSLVERR